MRHASELRVGGKCFSAATAGLVCCVFAAWAIAAEESPPNEAHKSQPRFIYHADPQHLWNRLHEAIFVRVGPQGGAYGRDRFEPLLWPFSKHLLKRQSCDRVINLLHEFARTKGEVLIQEPAKRALLQRDLWLVFNWLEGNHAGFADPQISDDQWRASQRRLRRPLAEVIGRLALSREEIERLPDNYAAAVATGKFAVRYDPQQPDTPYLPPNLFAADGPWVCVGRPAGPVTPEHLREDNGNAFTNSVFLVFVRLPAGRAATLDYLKQLRQFDQPLLIAAEDPDHRRDRLLPNPNLPQFPVGTEVALVRRSLLIDESHSITSTPLTESVQLRVFREVPEMTRATLDAALTSGTEANRHARKWQSFHELRLSRSLLFAGRAGGLRAVGADEPDFKTGFGAHPWDEFERPIPTGRTFSETSQLPVKETCFACHSLPGVYSLNSFFNFRTSRHDTNTRMPAALSESTPARIAAAAIKWKRDRPSWISLREMLAE